MPISMGGVAASGLPGLAAQVYPCAKAGAKQRNLKIQIALGFAHK